MTKKFHRRFLHFIKENSLFEKEDKVLLAVSGGVDSVVLAHLFALSQFNFAIAHCNFGLRGEASEKDEEFVTELAEKLQVLSYVKKFDTLAFAEINGLSIQMAARELRYNWFSDLMQEHHFKFLATAHHKNDVAETILVNLTKGAVLSGLRGILPKQKNIVRPLLWAEKDEVISYAAANNIQYREDSSNTETKYTRNKIRLKVIPELQQINPNLLETMADAAFLRSQISSWWEKFAAEKLEKCRLPHENFEAFSISKLKEEAVNEAVLYQYFSEKGFSIEQLKDVVKSFHHTETRTFEAGEYLLIKDRNQLVLLTSEAIEKPEIVYIEKEQKFAEIGSFRLELERAGELPAEWPKVSSISYIDVSQLKFPLQLRRWQQGDWFIPLGMKGRKKVSDFLTDAKVSAIEKMQQYVLVSGENIVWLVGRRVDERFKVNPDSKEILKLGWL